MRHDDRADVGTRHHRGPAERLDLLENRRNALHVRVDEDARARGGRAADAAVDAVLPARADHAVVHRVVRVDLPAEDVRIEAVQLLGVLGLDLPVDHLRSCRLAGRGAPRRRCALAGARGLLGDGGLASSLLRGLCSLLLGGHGVLVAARSRSRRCCGHRRSRIAFSSRPSSPIASRHRSATCLYVFGLPGALISEPKSTGAPKTMWMSVARPAQARPDLLHEVVEQPVDEDREDRAPRLVDDAPDAALRGQERVRIVVLLARPLGVEAHEEAAAPQQRRDLVEARQVQRRALPVAEDGRVHREEAHHAVHERPERVVVEEGRPHREEDAVRKPVRDELRGRHVEVEERPVVGHADDAPRRIPGRQALEPVDVPQARRHRADPPLADRALHQRGCPDRARPGAGSRARGGSARARARVSDVSPISRRSRSRSSPLGLCIEVSHSRRRAWKITRAPTAQDAFDDTRVSAA